MNTGVTAVRLGLPGMNGFDLLRQLKELPETASIPVIVLTPVK